MYGVAVSQYLKGDRATVGEYKKLLPRVQRLLSSHHAESRLDNNLEYSLRLADGRITLGQLLSPHKRISDETIPNLNLKQIGKEEHPFAHPVYWSGFICAGLR